MLFEPLVLLTCTAEVFESIGRGLLEPTLCSASSIASPRLAIVAAVRELRTQVELVVKGRGEEATATWNFYGVYDSRADCREADGRYHACYLAGWQNGLRFDAEKTWRSIETLESMERCQVDTNELLPRM